ncbi:hypothetical protein CTAYLR_000946 [Chrysophaeum taylorii]|uniref:PKD/REJ-like domain-containing protein n=1 Tax=Chrysophaeum taylorii TaxID=2483200 RepID=A0AAD7UFB3_9STRA|nr:hypothetical protein CTAYLR_000946 [Chrysophaeum taylorii]
MVTGMIRAACGDYYDCTCWNATSGATVVLAPSPPVLVSATIEAPSSVGACSALELSAAGSSGGGGRDLTFAWNATLVQDIIPGSRNCSTMLDEAEHTNDDVFVLSSVEACAGESIAFVVAVSNFFGETSVSSQRVKVLPGAAPEVKIVGGSVLTTFSTRKVQIRAEASASPSCDGRTKSNVALSFSWSVRYKAAGTETFGAMPYSSTRSDPRLYELAAYTLTAGDIVEFSVTVFESPTGTNNTAVAELTVLPSALVVVISGGDRTVNSFEALTIDASLSYDPDDLERDDLDFEWSCSDASIDTSTTLSSLLVAAGQLDATQSSPPYVFSVLVTDPLDTTRNASASVSIVASASDFVPAVSISPLSTEKANPSSRLVLDGTVEQAPQVALEATWSLAAGSEFVDGVALEDVARTDVSTTLAAGNDTTTVYLVLPADISLVAGASYTFILSASYDGEELGRSSLTVVANSSPVPGQVVVSPPSGTVLSTTYTFTASYWTDDATDLPLLYSFLSENSVLREATPSPEYSGVVLPQGTGANSTVLCSAKVSDQLGASATAYDAVVNAAETLSPADLANTTDSLLADAVGSADTELVFQVASAVASMLVADNDDAQQECLIVNCSTTLGRETCEDGETLCGDCIAPLVGEAGPSDAVCYEPVASCSDGEKDENEADVDCGGDSDCARCTLGKSCVAGTDCSSGRCSSAVCSSPLKTCDGGGCGSNGTCVYTDQLGDSIDECEETDDYCSASCVCDANAYGANCEYDEEEWESQLSLRESILSTLLETSKGMDPTSDASNMQASTCSSITSNPEALTSDSADAALRILFIATNATSQNGFEASTSGHLTTATSNIIASSQSSDSDIGSLLDSIGSSALVGAVAGEDASESCADSFCMTSSRTNAADLADAEFASPQGTGPGVQAGVSAPFGDDSVDVTLVEFTSGRNNATIDRQSSVARINVQSQGSRRRLESSSTTTVVTLTLQNYYPVSYSDGNASDLSSTVECAGVTGFVNVTCANNNETVSFNCTAYESRVNPCTSIAACRVWGGETWESSGCEVLNFTATNTTCRCELDNSAESADFTSTSELVAKEFTSVFKRNPLGNLAQTALVLYVFASIAIILCAMAFWGKAQDVRDAGAETTTTTTMMLSLYDGNQHAKKKGTVRMNSSKQLSPRSASRAKAMKALNDSLPLWVREKSAFRNYCRRLLEQHNLLNYMVFDPQLSRPIRALKLYTTYCWVLASEAALFLLAFPDLGCDDYDNEEDCLKPDSPYFPAIPACQWNPNVDPVCSLNASKGATITTYIILLLVISLILTPLSMIIDTIINVISLPVSRKEPKKSSVYVAPVVAENDGKNDETGELLNELEAACRPDIALDVRVDVIYRATNVALRQRRAELTKAVASGDPDAKRSLAPFERRYGFRPKYLMSWRIFFFKQETDDERFERKVRRAIRRDLKRADAYDLELKSLSDNEDRSRRITEFARLERLTLLEQRVYLKNKREADEQHTHEEAEDDRTRDLPKITPCGHWTAVFVLFVLIVFPIYYTLAVFAALTARSKPLAYGWLRTVCLFIIFDVIFYSPIKIWFFFLYLPSLIKLKLRSLGDPTDDDDLPFNFETPLFMGAIDYLAARHSKHLSMASIILTRRVQTTATTDDERRQQGKRWVQQIKHQKDKLLLTARLKKIDDENRERKRNSFLDPAELRHKRLLNVSIATFFLLLWGAIIILPDGLQDLVVGEVVIFAVNLAILGFFSLIGGAVTKAAAHVATGLGLLAIIILVLSGALLIAVAAWIIRRRWLRPDQVRVEPAWLSENPDAAKRRVINKPKTDGALWSYCQENVFDAFYAKQQKSPRSPSSPKDRIRPPAVDTTPKTAIQPFVLSPDSPHVSQGVAAPNGMDRSQQPELDQARGEPRNDTLSVYDSIGQLETSSPVSFSFSSGNDRAPPTRLPPLESNHNSSGDALRSLPDDVQGSIFGAASNNDCGEGGGDKKANADPARFSPPGPANDH